MQVENYDVNGFKEPGSLCDVNRGILFVCNCIRRMVYIFLGPSQLNNSFSARALCVLRRGGGR